MMIICRCTTAIEEMQRTQPIRLSLVSYSGADAEMTRSPDTLSLPIHTMVAFCSRHCAVSLVPGAEPMVVNEDDDDRMFPALETI